MCIIFKKLTIVCYEREWAKNKLLERKIITDNCLLRVKNNIKFVGKIKCAQKNRILFVD